MSVLSNNILCFCSNHGMVLDKILENAPTKLKVSVNVNDAADAYP